MSLPENTNNIRIAAVDGNVTAPRYNTALPLPSEDMSCERIQVVDENEDFTREHLGRQIARWGLANSGFKYHVVAVFEPRPTGKSTEKSTLLNWLFNSAVLDRADEADRSQATKGIWMRHGHNMSVMVMDVQGADGRDRDKAQEFERKSALFSLATSDVLVIHLSESQVRLSPAMVTGLITTIFEASLALFANSKGSLRKTMLLFVIRHNFGAAPLDIQVTLTADMRVTWDALQKPEALQNTRLTDYFDLSFTTLPLKVALPQQYEEEVVNLRSRFIDRTSDDYVFKQAYHKLIPADDVAYYMESVWERAKTDQELDFLTQQESLAQLRCNEIVAIVIHEFGNESENIAGSIRRGNVEEGLGEIMESWKTNALARFTSNAFRYNEVVYQQKVADTSFQLDTELRRLFAEQINNLRKECLGLFRKEVMEGAETDVSRFDDVVAIARNRWKTRFTDGAADAVLPGTDWSYDGDVERLHQDFTLIADRLRLNYPPQSISYRRAISIIFVFILFYMMPRT